MRTRLSVCQRKARYATREAAVEAARSIGLDLHPYKCDRCLRHHLTSRTKGRRVPRPSTPDVPPQSAQSQPIGIDQPPA
ncbi:MAG: hypothetical protein C0409_03070 [Novosphingobium sp.]|nr:hypothetical protein [Novosphingobium sp.]